ncbi:hypothetical protein HDV57DRAFT_162661 [Trichoderma longibrachiatum]|uniref:Uncharacterized protein n=1 Tax=Trichoderma longibrachiatum ATCC 18648 TaxID=983965 RepID=A0A2T4C1H9_TRILO|nr:hypothetical protein M440DRAFT_341588 [Trichoderma longibrachiatum ATCC 18648]
MSLLILLHANSAINVHPVRRTAASGPGQDQRRRKTDRHRQIQHGFRDSGVQGPVDVLIIARRHPLQAPMLEEPGVTPPRARFVALCLVDAGWRRESAASRRSWLVLGPGSLGCFGGHLGLYSRCTVMALRGYIHVSSATGRRAGAAESEDKRRNLWTRLDKLTQPDEQPSALSRLRDASSL